MSKKEKPEHALSVQSLQRELEFLDSPLHVIARGKHSPETINISAEDAQGAKSLWKVSFNLEYGAPGELSYKIDRLHIDKLLDREGPIKPKVLELGGLNDIAESLNLKSRGGSVRTAIKKALLANAFAAIEVKRSIKLKDDTTEWIEGAFTRYSVVFKGEKLPNGTIADSVTIIFSDLWHSILNQVGTRPLNYHYLKILPPLAQRFYEIASPKIFACIKFNNPHAIVRYGQFCEQAPQKRYPTWEKAYKQMYKILKQHLDSGYIEKWSRRKISGDSKDWELLIVPGELARREYDAFTGKSAMPAPIKQEPKRKAAVRLVRYFWEAKGVTNARGIKKNDVIQVVEWLESLSEEQIEFAIDYALKEKDPPKFFAGVASYLPLALDAYAKKAGKGKAGVTRLEYFVDEDGQRKARRVVGS